MTIEYNSVREYSPEEFEKLTIPREKLNDTSSFYKASQEDKACIERLLDVRPGTLDAENMYLQNSECDGCGKQHTPYDFYFTALVDTDHSKSVILHTTVGVKMVIQRPRRIRCSICGTRAVRESVYSMLSYGCEEL